MTITWPPPPSCIPLGVFFANGLLLLLSLALFHIIFAASLLKECGSSSYCCCCCCCWASFVVKADEGWDWGFLVAKALMLEKLTWC